MNEENIEKTAFIIQFGLFQFNVMPFGLKNAPTLFQRMMNHILQEYLDDFIAVYLDDIIIYLKTFEEHIEHITKVLEKLREANLMIKLRKCKFFEAEISFLGHIVRRHELKSDLKKIEKIKKLSTSINLINLKSALGLFSYYRRFIKNFSKIAKPMNKLLKKEIPFIWMNEQENAFRILK